MSPIFRVLPALLLAFAATLVHADPPARVGRLAVVENSVNFHADIDDEGGPASINWPISSGAMLDTGRHGRSEVWVGSTAFRLAPESQLAFPALDDRQVLLRLTQGSMAVSIFDRDQVDDVTVETPEGRIRFGSPGRYRIDVLADHTELTAQAGTASFSDDLRSMSVMAGQKASSYGGGQMRLDADFQYDAFDNWVAERENAALPTDSRRYVSPAMTGYQDLDNYGNWSTSAEYGAIWYPRDVDDDWAPYRFGRWAWVAPWGWTWVDQSPWGFAPFHYGRWVQVHRRWAWVPGAYVARPVYAPALVAWIGNPGWSVGFRSGAAPAVGWFPLAPREVYVPGFHASSQFVHRINGGHARNVAEIDRAIRSGPRHDYAHRAQPQAVTIVPSRQMSEGRPIRSGDFARHDRRDLEGARASSAPANVVVPPAKQHSPRDGRREAEPTMQRAPAAPVRAWPGSGEPRQPAVAPAPFPNRDENRRGGFGRDERRAPGSPEGQPTQPAMREMAPARAPEATRVEGERRWPAAPVREAEPVRRAPEAAQPAVPAPFPNRDENRRGGFGRDERRAPGSPEGQPAQPATREMAPARVPEASRVEGERRWPAPPVREAETVRRAPEVVPPAAPAADRPGPAWLHRNQGRDEQRQPMVRENAPQPPAAREMPAPEMQRQQREAPRPFEMQRQREMPQPAPQAAPPQPMRAPMPQVAPAPPPVREMPRPQPQAQPQPAPQQQRSIWGERRRDQGG